MDWNQETRVTATQAGTFACEVAPHWTSLQGAHGGIVAALAVRAAEHAMQAAGTGTDRTLRAATFGYARGNLPGALTAKVDIVRTGRSMTTTHVAMEQDGAPTTLARLHHSTPWEGPSFSDAPPPPPLPAAFFRLDDAPRAPHLANVETHLDATALPFSGAARGEWRAWCRPKHGPTFDSAWLTMFGDYFPPAVFARSKAPSRAVTVEYAIQIHDAAGRWTLGPDERLPTRMHVFHSHDGFAVEDGWIWLPDGRLLATVRQTRLAG